MAGEMPSSARDGGVFAIRESEGGVMGAVGAGFCDPPSLAK